MAKPRILILTLAYFPFVGGAEVAVKELTDRLAGQFEFEIISANVKKFWSKYFFPFWAYREALRRHRKQKYDLVWAIMANQAGMAGALFKKRHRAVPFLLTLQEGDDLASLAYRLRLLGPKLFGVFRRADHIQAISHYLGRWARGMGARCPITVVPNGVDLEKFSFRNQRPDLGIPLRSGLGQTIITTSRLVKKNGVDTLIESLRFLSESVKLQILGGGPEEMSLKQLVSRFHLDNRVDFLDQISPSEIPSYLAQADVFVRPSRSEGLGNSFLEAMAAGLPVVGTPVGGILDFLFDSQGETLKPAKVSPLYQTGWFCEVDNPKSIAEKVGHILDSRNREQVEQVINNAKKLVQEKYDWSGIARQISAIIASLCGSR